MNISDGDILTLGYGPGSNFANWNGTIPKGNADYLARCSIVSEDDASTDPILSDSITDSTKGAATVTGTVDNGKATLNVACDKACVVAYTTDEGKTYTRANAEKADSGYNFVVPDYSENMKFVVAVKGDVSGNGALDSDDVVQIKAAQLGKLTTFTDLQKLVSDINGDGILDSDETVQVKAAQLGKLSLAW